MLLQVEDGLGSIRIIFARLASIASSRGRCVDAVPCGSHGLAAGEMVQEHVDALQSPSIWDKGRESCGAKTRGRLTYAGGQARACHGRAGEGAKLIEGAPHHALQPLHLLQSLLLPGAGRGGVALQCAGRLGLDARGQGLCLGVQFVRRTRAAAAGQKGNTDGRDRDDGMNEQPSGPARATPFCWPYVAYPTPGMPSQSISVAVLEGSARPLIRHCSREFGLQRHLPAE